MGKTKPFRVKCSFFMDQFQSYCDFKYSRILITDNSEQASIFHFFIFISTARCSSGTRLLSGSNPVQSIHPIHLQLLNSQNSSEQFRTVQNSSEQFRTVQNSSKQFKTVQNSSKQFRTVQNSSEQFRTVQNSSEQFSVRV